MDKKELNHTILESVVRSIIYRGDENKAIIKFNSVVLTINLQTKGKGENQKQTAHVKIEKIWDGVVDSTSNITCDKFYEVWYIVLDVIDREWYTEGLEIYMNDTLACELRKY